jgi:hypothetical protein
MLTKTISKWIAKYLSKVGKGQNVKNHFVESQKKENRKSKSWLIDQNVKSIFKVDQNVKSDKNRSWSEHRKWQ